MCHCLLASSVFGVGLRPALLASKQWHTVAAMKATEPLGIVPVHAFPPHEICDGLAPARLAEMARCRRQAADCGRGPLGDPWNHCPRPGEFREQSRQHPWSLHWGWLVLSGLLYLVGLLPEGLFWRRALRAMGQDAPLWRTLRAYFIGHLGKYVPGKAMVVVLRTGLIPRPRRPCGVAAASVFLETLDDDGRGASWRRGDPRLVFGQRRPLLWASLGLMLVARRCPPCRRSFRDWPDSPAWAAPIRALPCGSGKCRIARCSGGGQ